MKQYGIFKKILFVLILMNITEAFGITEKSQNEIGNNETVSQISMNTEEFNLEEAVVFVGQYLMQHYKEIAVSNGKTIIAKISEKLSMERMLGTLIWDKEYIIQLIEAEVSRYMR